MTEVGVRKGRVRRPVAVGRARPTERIGPIADSLTTSMSETAYDRIGRGYAKTRQADPRVAAP
jgi:hypothetical protein